MQIVVLVQTDGHVRLGRSPEEGHGVRGRRTIEPEGEMRPIYPRVGAPNSVSSQPLCRTAA